ncbi:unnamed protein product [Lactuca saligna]|uniref:Uncharacterized protein n=1 Tax=Lactuca saligna TaxID=75948 RepID=A0AA36EG57_LACSI|nr:unnamed protein product [Lactuca saligna]
MWFLTQNKVRLNIPVVLALYLSDMDLGSMPLIKICGGHWVTRLALSYKVDTSMMVPIPIRDMTTTTLGKIRVLEGPVVPPPAQPSHNGASASSTHPRDTDDDIEESSKHDEGEYESSE